MNNNTTVAFEDWSKLVMKKIFPNANFVRVIDHFWSNDAHTIVNIEFSRKKNGYSHFHFYSFEVGELYNRNKGHFDEEFNFIY